MGGTCYVVRDIADLLWFCPNLTTRRTTALSPVRVVTWVVVAGIGLGNLAGRRMVAEVLQVGELEPELQDLFAQPVCFVCNLGRAWCGLAGLKHCRFPVQGVELGLGGWPWRA